MGGRKWTEEEENFIKENWREMSDAEIAEEIDRTKNAIRNRRNKLDITRPESHNGKFNQGIRWTQEKIEYLKKNHQEMNHSEIAEEMDISTQAVRDKVFELDLKNKQHQWTGAEEEFLERIYSDRNSWTSEDIAEYLELTIHQVDNKVGRLNLTYVDQKPFDKNELEFLKNNYDEKTDREIAEELGRDLGTIREKKQQLDLLETPHWSQEEKEFLEDNWEELSDSIMAEKLDRGVEGVRKNRRKLGLIRESMIDTDRHWEWEELCETIASDIFHNPVFQKELENGLRPDIYLPKQKKVIDAKTSAYRGLNDLDKYMNSKEVEKVEAWIIKPSKVDKEFLVIKNIFDLRKLVESSSVEEKIKKFTEETKFSQERLNIP